ncbi:MAG: hypothetical protein M1821_006066 [Bathelium mastoideum]|nr:MAG: hypothetical protein M1821_006066 [Bathelium mastoideum]
MQKRIIRSVSHPARPYLCYRCYTKLSKHDQPSHISKSTLSNIIPPALESTTTSPREESDAGQQHEHAQPAQQEQPYILTLHLTPSLSDPLTTLRQTHYPAHLPGAHLPAHLTLFHALAASRLAAIHAAIVFATTRTPPFPVRFTPADVFFLGGPYRPRGLAVELGDAQRGGEHLRRLRARLKGRLRTRAGAWEWMTPQDRRGGWRGHVTVMRKRKGEGGDEEGVGEGEKGEGEGEGWEERVRRVGKEVKEGWQGCEGEAVGVRLWRYERDGGWTFERDYAFGGREEGDDMGNLWAGWVERE